MAPVTCHCGRASSAESLFAAATSGSVPAMMDPSSRTVVVSIASTGFACA